MKGFISFTVLSIIILSTALLGGAGFGVYKYQEMQKENEQIKVKLDEQKDREIERLENELEEAKNEPVSEEERGEQYASTVQTRSEAPSSKEAPSLDAAPSLSSVKNSETKDLEGESVEFVEELQAEPTGESEGMEEASISDADWQDVKKAEETWREARNYARDWIDQTEANIVKLEKIKDGYTNWSPDIKDTIAASLAEKGFEQANEAIRLMEESLLVTENKYSYLKEMVSSVRDDKKESFLENYNYHKKIEEEWLKSVTIAGDAYKSHTDTYNDFIDALKSMGFL